MGILEKLSILILGLVLLPGAVALLFTMFLVNLVYRKLQE